LGASQRISVLAATFILVAGLVAAAFWSSHADYGLLYGGLSETEAAKVVSALNEAKVAYKVSGSGSISVPVDKIYSTRMQLASKGIPQGDGVGFEIFDKANFGISDFVQRANYLRALQGELARTISQLDEVQSARVMIVQPENRLLLDKEKYATASVFVHVRGNSALAPSSINSIRFLVANSVEGLKPNHVSVVDNQGNVLSENQDNDSLSGMSATQLQSRRNLEQYLSKKAQDILEKVLGPGQAIVRVSAEVNYDTITKSEEKFDPDGQVIRSQTKNDETVDSATTQNNSPAGISANTPSDTNSPVASAGALNKSKNSKNITTTSYEIGKTHTEMVQMGGGLKRITAAVSVAQNYEGKGTERKLVARTSEEIEKLKRIVSSALGADATRGDTIALEELPFNDTFATDVTTQLNTQQKQDFWLTLGKNLLYPGLGVGAFLLLLRLFKDTPVQEIPVGVPVGQLAGMAHSSSVQEKLSQIARDSQPQVVTVDVLNRLIKDNPNNMTSAIRDWMNRGRPAEAARSE
jgi:flagellar M-ring protein FliF